ncbi:hypothetical protein SAMN05444162_2852 [Paenibacillaceae bacterium GAS479]|nr:hypothetical protein SAMN05444162_2852 [Paenibacillaceae bacterium GAS479]
MKAVNFSGFDQAHEKWLNQHLKARKGERRDRLRRGHSHGEILFLREVWWPLFGNFENLHPEYEIVDWRGSPCYLDFAWLPGIQRFNIDVKGYGPHVQQTDRTKYSRELMRELYLQTLGYCNISLPYDTLSHEPQLIRSMMKNLLQPFLVTKQDKTSASKIEFMLLNYIRQQSTAIYPYKAAREVGIHEKTAIKYLRKLSLDGKIKALTNGSRVYRYIYTESMLDRT